MAYCASVPRRIPFAAHGLNFPSVHRHQENVQLSAACRPEEDNLSDFLNSFIKWWFCSVLPRIPKHFYPNFRTNRGPNQYIYPIYLKNKTVFPYRHFLPHGLNCSLQGVEVETSTSTPVWWWDCCKLLMTLPLMTFFNILPAEWRLRHPPSHYHSSTINTLPQHTLIPTSIHVTMASRECCLLLSPDWPFEQVLDLIQSQSISFKHFIL